MSQMSRASALSQPQPRQAAAPVPAAPAPPAPTLSAPAAAQLKRGYLSAYAKDFHTVAACGTKTPLPLEQQRADGGLCLRGGLAVLPEDGYYMLLWELGVAGVNGEATLQLGINDAASQLTYALCPGYDSGQQISWLSAGDKVGLFAQAGEAQAELQCGSAQLTVIRLG